MLKSKLENLFNRFNKKHYYSLAGVLLLVVIGVFFVVTPAQAITIIDIGTGALNAILRGASYIFLTLAKLAISFTIFALEFFIKVAQYNNYVDAPTVLVGWIMVRDVANMFFVIALLLIAFGTMMGLENYMWTKTLVKLILAAVFINFSNLICGLIIDIAHVFTITFVNAIAGVAGGNLIKMFKMGEILSMSQTGAIKFTEGSDLQLEVLGASITAFIFAMIAFATMIAYLVLMVARLVVLWVLIVLSPLAFALQTIPSTEQYAKEWWQKFGKQVIVAPVMVFFLWLAFATVGSGDVAVQQSLAPGEKDLVDVQRVIGREQNEPSLSLSKATTWDNMANFLIPIALLIVGLNVVQQIGVVGSGMVGGVVNFGKKVATIASGYAAGRWLAGKVGEGTKMAGKGVAYGAGYVVGVERIGNYFKRQKESFDAWRADTGLRPKSHIVYETEVNEKGETVFKLDKKGNKIAKRDEKTGQIIREFDRDKEGNLIMEETERGLLQRAFHAGVARDVASRKKLDKTKNFAKNRMELLDKRTTGVPTGWFMKENEKIDALDRVEQGMLLAEKARSGAKTEEFQALGQKVSGMNPRFKDGKWQLGKETLTEQTAAHEVRADRAKEALAEGKARARAVYARGKGRGSVNQTVLLKIKTERAKEMEREVTEERKLDFVKGQKLLEERAKKIKDRAGKLLVDLDEDERKVKVLAEGEDKDKRLAEIAKMRSDASNDIAHAESLLNGDESAIKIESEKMRSEGTEGAVSKSEADNLIRGAEAIVLGGLYESLFTIKSRVGLMADTVKLGEDMGLDDAKGRLINEAVRSEKKALLKLQEIANLLKEADREKSSKIAENETKIKTEEANLLTLRTQLKQLEDTRDAKPETEVTEEEKKKIVDLKKSISGKESEVSGIKLENLQLNNEIRKKASEDPVVFRKIEELELEAENIRNSSVAYQNAAIRARQLESKRVFTSKQKSLESNVEQEIIWDKRGLSTPTTAIVELIEQYEKDFREMNYEMVIENMRGTLRTMMEKRVKGEELDEGDKATMMGLFKHAMNNSWVDDAIISIMGDEQLSGFFKEHFGWQDSVYSPEKINQVEMMFATGMDKKFARIHKHMSGLMDKYVGELGMSVAEFLEKIGNGDIQAREGRNIGLDASDVEYYKQVSNENEANFQLLANLRDQAIANNHAENAGHAQFHDVGGGKKMFIGVGSKMAHDYVWGDVVKMAASKRAAMHSHATMSIDEKTGFVTDLDDLSYQQTRGSISTLTDFTPTNERYINHSLGLSADANTVDFRDEEGRIKLLGDERAIDAIASDSHHAVRFANGYKTKKRGVIKDKKKVATQIFTERLLLGKLQRNPVDFLLTMAAGAGISKSDALSRGTLKMRFQYLDENGELQTWGDKKGQDNINVLIADYNRGLFTSGLHDGASVRKIGLMHFSGQKENEDDQPKT